MPIQPVILSGGIGGRLWPASRRMQPKQLLPLVEERTMIHATVDRVNRLEAVLPPLVVTSALHADFVQREMALAGQDKARLILEPAGRNTASAVAVAAHEAMKHGEDPLMLILPSDHTISAVDIFLESVHAGTDAASDGYLVTFGIAPSRPETGYGYIKIGKPITGSVFEAAEFREKPDHDTAVKYIESGEYLWNAGMFLLKASSYLSELEAHAPDTARLSQTAWEQADRIGSRILLDAESFEAIEGDSIDYAVMEHTSRAAVVPTDPGWSDVGSWESLWDMADKDSSGNVIIGDVVHVGVSGSYVRAGDRLVAVVGVDDIVVVDTPDAVLVAGREQSQDVKKVVDILASEVRKELETSGVEHRPWGTARTISSGPGFRIRHLSLDLNAETPMKTLKTRIAHWLVVRGVATVTTGDTSRIISERETTSIEAGEGHQLVNSGDRTLEVIEVEVATTLDEEDTKLFLDAHERTERGR